MGKKHRPKAIKGIAYSLLGIAAFWLIASMLLFTTALYCFTVLQVTGAVATGITLSIAAAIGLGVVLTRRTARKRIELGMAPIGGLGLSICTTVLAFADLSTAGIIGWAIPAGFLCSVFAVPIMAWFKARINGHRFNNIIDVKEALLAIVFIVISSGCFAFFTTAGSWKTGFTVIACMAWIATFITLFNIPAMLLRFIFYSIARFIYKIKVVDGHHIPQKTGALLVANHLSFMDSFLIVASVPRQVRFVMLKEVYEHPLLHWLMKRLNMIPISPREGKQGLDRFNEACQREINNGHLVCIFAEGQISRNGHLLEFKKGIEHIAKGIDAPIIPLHMDGVLGTPFTYVVGRGNVKFNLKALRKRVTISIGKPSPANSSAFTIRQRVQELNANAFEHRIKENDTLGRHFIAATKKHSQRAFVSDAQGSKTYRQVLKQAKLLAGRLQEDILHEQHVGVMLPKSVENVVVNLALILLGKTTVNIDPAFTNEEHFFVVNKAQLNTIITTNELNNTYILNHVNRTLLTATLFAELSDSKQYHVNPNNANALPDGRILTKNDIATIVFERGSDGFFKGIPITHQNILANIAGLRQVYHLESQQSMLGLMPFYHAYGYTLDLWLPILVGMQVVFPNSNTMENIATTMQQHPINIVLGKIDLIKQLHAQLPTETWKEVAHIITGEEQADAAFKATIQSELGITIRESFGLPECAPIIAVNTPDFVGKDVAGKSITQPGTEAHTVGRPLPGVAVKAVNPENLDEELPPNEEGILLVKGANVIESYLNDIQLTRKYFHRNWFITHQKGRINSDGFIVLSYLKTH